MEVYIEPMFDRREPMGGVFLSYARNDRDKVRDGLEAQLTASGIPYFRDEKHINPGEKFVQAIERALSHARAGVIVLSPSSIKSSWVWFEFGIMVGSGKQIVPFLLETDGMTAAEISAALPDFVRQYQSYSNAEELVRLVKSKIFDYEPFTDNDELNSRINGELRRSMIEYSMEFRDSLVSKVRFGYLLVRFGRNADLAVQTETNQAARSIGAIHRPFFAKTTYDVLHGSKLRVQMQVPVHKVLGVVFKPFVDVLDISRQGEVALALVAAGAYDVHVSGSAEKQRLYFCLPFPDGSMLCDEGGIVNNYLFPC